MFVRTLAALLPSASQMHRVMASHRARVHQEPLARYTCYDEARAQHVLPPLEALLGMSVVVSTTRACSELLSAGVPQGHFTHIVIDEAAQLIEAEGTSA